MLRIFLPIGDYTNSPHTHMVGHSNITRPVGWPSKVVPHVVEDFTT